MFRYLSFVYILILVRNNKAEDGKSKKATQDRMQVDPFNRYSKALVECDEKWIAFTVSFEHDFNGIIYTRGDYNNRNSPCFLTAKKGKDFALKFPYDKCGIKFDKKERGYGTTVIVQHDKELTMMGDLAFKFICRNEQTSEPTIKGMRSQISFVNPDPASDPDDAGYHTSMSASKIAILKPIVSDDRKEEL